MADEQVDVLLASDLMRTQQTATPAAQQLDRHIITSPIWREQSFGVVEGMQAAEIQARHPQIWQEWIQFREEHAIPGGESARQFHSRVLDALHALAQAHPQRRVLLVTHGGVLDMVWRTAHALSLNGPRRSDIPNAGFNRIRLPDATDPTRIDILDWADTRHLADMPAQPNYNQARHLPANAAGKPSAV